MLFMFTAIQCQKGNMPGDEALVSGNICNTLRNIEHTFDM